MVTTMVENWKPKMKFEADTELLNISIIVLENGGMSVDLEAQNK